MNFRIRKLGLQHIWGAAPSGGGGGTTTFDPVNISSNIFLTNSNLTANLDGLGGPYASARSLASHSTGKFYFEITDTVGVDSNVAVGIINASGSLNTYLGVDSNSISVFGGGGNWTINNTNVGSAPLFTSGDIVGIAVDFGAGLIWLRNLSAPTTWNGGGSADPAAGLGGQSISAITGPYFAGLSMNGSGSGYIMTGNFGGSSYVASAPSGFGNL